MSRNTRIRQMAEKLPLAPNLINGKPQYDGAGKLIMANHFRNLKEIQDKLAHLGHRSNCPKTLSAFNFYVQAVLKYNQQKLKREKRDKLFVYAFILISVIAVIIKYLR